MARTRGLLAVFPGPSLPSTQGGSGASFARRVGEPRTWAVAIIISPHGLPSSVLCTMDNWWRATTCQRRMRTSSRAADRRSDGRFGIVAVSCQRMNGKCAAASTGRRRGRPPAFVRCRYRKKGRARNGPPGCEAHGTVVDDQPRGAEYRILVGRAPALFGGGEPHQHRAEGDYRWVGAHHRSRPPGFGRYQVRRTRGRGNRERYTTPPGKYSRGELRPGGANTIPAGASAN